MGKKHFADAIDWYTRAINQQALSDSDTALYRAAKAYFALNLLLESTLHCQNGLKHDPSNEELKKLLRQIESKKMEHEQREAQANVYFFVETMHDLVSAIESRGLKIGKAMYQGLTGLRKPVLDKNNILRWPVLLLYAEVMSSDFIEDFCETEMLSANLDMISFF
ncbi:tetratricopeptide repeat protein 4 homolog [Prunus persica]|uniref:tetratricopeptide repeat protein 4 homolog n=1 Tax=Prunus persica TaxID=3760 RepID=UPI0009ABA992|nr:tetratricopeptide repeat protein 4 homolog [Prunus persica]